MNSKDLLKRLSIFADKCRQVTEKLPKTSFNIIYSNQLNRSSSSPGANYIEAVYASSSKEFILRLRICRKELKESDYWLGLVKTSNNKLSSITSECSKLQDEADELIRIFSSSLKTSERNQKIKNHK